MTVDTVKKPGEKWILPLYKIYTDEEDVNLITKIIRRGSQWAIGPEIEEFENCIKDYVGVDYCVALNSGTSALHSLFIAYGIKQNDEIIVPSFSFISTANAVRFVKAKPVFSDIEEETFGLDPNKLDEKITNKTKAVVPMDYGGLSCKISDIKKITSENNLLLIEDAAESLGSLVNGKKSGSLADSAIFSFCGNKVLTTGEGGAVITNSKQISEKVKMIRSHGRTEVLNYFEDSSDAQYVDLGYNWRMSSITAALGISQIKKLDKIIKMRQENAQYISSRIQKYKRLQTPNSPQGFEHVYQMYSIILSDKKTRDDLHTHLDKKRIFSKVYFTPIHLSNYYKETMDTQEGLLPVTEKISNQILTLPLYPNMTAEEKNYLVESLSEFFEKL